jgi:aspartate/methionine/tyrosine aminotransferase
LIGLREALSAYLAERDGAAVDSRTQILITGGAMHALLCAMAAVIEPGDEVLLFTPSYFFEGTIQLAGGRTVAVPQSEDDGFAWNLEALAERITPRTRVILLNTPANPTGVVATGDCLQQIAEFAEEHDLFIICDESYDLLVYDGAVHHGILRAAANRPRNILVGSMTKSFSMAPWRVGYVVASAPVVEAVLKVLEWTCLFGPHVNQRVAELVLRADRGWLAGAREAFEANRNRMIALLSSCTELSFAKPQGNPFLFLNVSRITMDDTQFATALLTDYGVPCTPGSLHGAPGYVRIPFGGPADIVSEAASRILTLIRSSE